MLPSWIQGKIPVWYLCVVLAGAVLGLYLIGTQKVQQKYRAYNKQIEAAQLMKTCLEQIREYRLSLGIPIDPRLDPNKTGIIGEEYTDLTTTLGNLEAKRTATNPAFAALLVRYFTEAEVQSGDGIAIGASGSFPALILATLSAVNAMHLRPLLIYSFGASMYGANIPEFTFLHMLAHLKQQGLLPYEPIAVSLGGGYDRAEGLFEPNAKAVFLKLAEAAGFPIIAEENLAENIRQRQQIYQEAAKDRPIACFVNIGGASANYGKTSASLKFPNGLVLQSPLPPDYPEQGLIFEYASQGIPVIHLLNIKGLATSNGLPIDPAPLPSIGEGGVYYTITYHPLLTLLVLLIELVLIILGSVWWK